MKRGRTRPEDLVATVNVNASSIIGSLLVILSGVILYADYLISLFGITIDYEFKYYSSLETAVWLLSNTISPLLIVLAIPFKPRTWSYVLPVTAFTIQGMFILNDEMLADKSYFWLYTIILVVALSVSLFFLKRLAGMINRRVAKLTAVIQQLVGYIAIHIRDNYVAEEDRTKYLQDNLETFDDINNKL